MLVQWVKSQNLLPLIKEKGQCFKAMLSLLDSPRDCTFLVSWLCYEIGDGPFTFFSFRNSDEHRNWA